MSKVRVNIDKIILDYIIENDLLYGFDKLKVFDIYTYKQTSGEYPLKTEIYGWKRLYRFKIGNFDQDIYIDFGNYSAMDATLKKTVNKIEYTNTAGIINFLKSDIYRNSNIIAFLANLLKLDIEKIIQEYNANVIERETKIIKEKISGIDREINRLEKEKKDLENKLKSFSNGGSNPDAYVDINDVSLDKTSLL